MPQLLSFHFGTKLWSQDALDFFPFKKVFIFSRFSLKRDRRKNKKILKNCKHLFLVLEMPNPNLLQLLDKLHEFGSLPYSSRFWRNFDRNGGVKSHKYEENKHYSLCERWKISDFCQILCLAKLRLLFVMKIELRALDPDWRRNVFKITSANILSFDELKQITWWLVNSEPKVKISMFCELW